MSVKLPDDFDGFKPTLAQEFRVKGQGGIALSNVNCPISIRQSDTDNQISVAIDADATGLENIFVSNENNTVVIDADYKKLVLASRTPRILVYVPAFAELHANLKGQASLVSKAPHKKAELLLEENARAAFAADKMQVRVAGTARLTATSMKGDVYVNLTEMGRAEVTGTFDRIKTFVSGHGHLTTMGATYGDLYAEAHDHGHIVHRGLVMGVTTSSYSGFGKIDLG